MENRFHLAIPAGDLDKAIKFYCDTLGCSRGNAEFKYPAQRKAQIEYEPFA